MYPSFLKKVEIRLPSFDSTDKTNPLKVYHKVNALVEGADEFLQIGCGGGGFSTPTPVAPGVYDMQVANRKIEKNGKTFHFVELVHLVPHVAK